MIQNVDPLPADLFDSYTLYMNEWPEIDLQIIFLCQFVIVGFVLWRWL